MSQTSMNQMYQELGISEEVYAFGQKIEEQLKDRFENIDQVT